ncbi:hypothetical protein FAZ78_23640 [Cereibacter changlensis]|uniref:Uncharacterized protein n=1 Tax=Cereibacter changlensis TaxID=402884 RepID=A0A4U0YYK3_9RHOB|nr:hypothetical protein FAZ78_23640 [Cereibacter changlensis]
MIPLRPAKPGAAPPTFATRQTSMCAEEASMQVSANFLGGQGDGWRNRGDKAAGGSGEKSWQRHRPLRPSRRGADPRRRAR